ncbi:MAG: hypothetical protein JRG83_06590 [Deltaproteobacteria bacterium]|nr:hypothetical protein [Deltaproteobacteria bacterium]
MIRATLAGVLVLGLTACPAPPTPPPAGPITDALRDRALREAEVWHPIDTAGLDVHSGPPGSRAPDITVDCTFVVPHSPPGGKTPKFLCRLADGSLIKVKYGPDNMEVHGEIFGSRLLWLLGFYSDRIDPVRVRCRGCPEDPWDFLQGLDPSDPRPPPPSETVLEFSPASTESYFGARIEAHAGQGLAWPALLATRSNYPGQAATQSLHREALTLLAAFLGHGDSKPGNQTLACHPDGGTPSRCKRSVAYIGDLGSILGNGGKYRMSKVDIEAWEDAPVWAEDAPCSAHFRTHRLGTLFDTPISEPARAFLAARLSAASDAQIRELFAVAGLDGLGCPGA